MSERRLCPVPACGACIRRGLLMCAAHWHLVPRKIRNEVKASWRELRGALRYTGVGHRTLVEHVHRYRMASNAAVAAAATQRVTA